MLPWWPVAWGPGGLDAILDDPALKGAQVGVCVTDTAGNTVFERNAELRFVPASNEKVLTVLFALDTLGPAYQGQTRVWKGKKQVDVEATGDASLTLHDLRDARKRLKLVQGWPVHIHGPFSSSLGPGWEWDDLPWYYAAPTCPLSFDRAAFDVWAENGRLEPLPPELRVKVVRRSAGPVKAEFDPATNTLTVTGRLPKARSRLGQFAQPDPMRAAARALGGEAVVDATPVPERDADLVVTGRPLKDVAKDCLEESDNMIAERLLVLAALKVGPVAGSPYPSAADLAHTALAKASQTPPDWFRPVDGSGLSRHNQVAPKAMCQLLRWALARPYSDVWLAALAAPGEGTLKSRLKDSTFVGKTGTMDAVVSLSGYVTTKAGTKLVMSFLVNNSIAKAADVRAVQDRFVRALEAGTDSNDPR